MISIINVQILFLHLSLPTLPLVVLAYLSLFHNLLH